MHFPDKLLFIVGAPRSGTTWLQLMLAQHENIGSAQETFLFAGYMGGLFTSAEHFDRNERRGGLSRIIPKERYFELCKQFSDAAIAELAQEKPQASIFLEKTPAHIRHCDRILKLYPEAYFIELVRDPRAVVASLRAVHWGKPGIVSNTRQWKDAIKDGQNLTSMTERHIRISYETLLEDTESTLRQVMDFIGEDPSDDQLRDWISRTSIDKLRNDTEAVQAPWDMKTEPAGFYRKGRPDAWREELSRGQIKQIEHLARDEMTTLGYPPVTRGATFPWRLWMSNRLDDTTKRLNWYQNKF